MTLLFLKRLNDSFEENAEKLIQEGKSKKEAYENKNRHYFFVSEESRWSVLSSVAENIGEKIDHVCRIIERENPDLDGVLTNTKYNDKRVEIAVDRQSISDDFDFINQNETIKFLKSHILENYRNYYKSKSMTISVLKVGSCYDRYSSLKL